MCARMIDYKLAFNGLFSGDERRVGVIMGTGPSLTDDVIEKTKKFKRFGANLTYRLGADVVLGCNSEFWDYYERDARIYPCDKWTTRPQALENRWEGVNYIEERWIAGLSRDKSRVAAHHGSGPQVVNLAYHYGCKVMLLVGWDMRYGGKLDNKSYTMPRHYFGEYPASMQHWPRTGPDGELTGLIKEMETIYPEEYGIKIINCTPDSALKCFPMMCLDEAIEKYGASYV